MPLSVRGYVTVAKPDFYEQISQEIVVQEVQVSFSTKGLIE